MTNCSPSPSYRDLVAQVEDFDILYPGDLAVLRHGRAGNAGKVFRIVASNSRSKYHAEDEDGKRWNAPFTAWAKAPEDATFTPAPRPETPEVFLGSVVTHPGGKLTGGPSAEYVVLKFTVSGSKDKVNLARLGGDGDRFYRGVLTSSLQVREN